MEVLEFKQPKANKPKDVITVLKMKMLFFTTDGLILSEGRATLSIRS